MAEDLVGGKYIARYAPVRDIVVSVGKTTTQFRRFQMTQVR